MWLVPGWVTRSLHVTFGVRSGVMTTAGLKLPCPCFIPQGYLCVSLGVETSQRGEVVSRRQVRFTSTSNQPCCRAQVRFTSTSNQPCCRASFYMRFGASLSVEVKQRVHVVSAWMGDQVVARYIWWQRWDNDNCRTGVALPMLLSPVLFVCKPRGRDFSKGKVVSRREVRFISILHQPRCGASFYSNAVWCISLRGS